MWRNVWELEMVPLLQHTLVILSQFILLLRLLTWQFFFLPFFTVRHRQFCLSDIFNARSIYPERFFMTACEWVEMNHLWTERTCQYLSFVFFLSFSLSLPRSFFFLAWSYYVCEQREWHSTKLEMDLCFLSVKALRVCVSVSVCG